MNWECVRGLEPRAGRALLLSLTLAATGCSSSDDGPGTAQGTTGGSPGAGGVPAASGGTPSANGGTPVTASGGAPVGNGGAPVGNGGTPAGNGGDPVNPGGSGGTPVGTGGAPATGGGSGIPAEPCGLNTGFAGDEHCILPPPPDKGFQVHIGPSNYTSPEADYVLKPGDERTTDFTVTSTNDKDVYFFMRQYRLRPSAHHVIISTPNGATGVEAIAGRRIGTANTSQDYPASGVVAPEDQDVGIPLAAHSKITVSFHAINTSGETALREAWINFWYKDAAEVKQPAKEWFETGNVTFAIPPNAKQTIGPSTCTVQGTGRMLWLYGHRHANNVRFLVNRIRGGKREVIYDANKWDEPLLLEYSSIVTNVAPDPATGREGGWNGILDLLPGDKIEWSCDIDNKQNSTLRFTNQTYLGEMCIVDAEAIGASCL